MHSQDQYTSINPPFNRDAETVTLSPQADVGMEDSLLPVRILTPDFPLYHWAPLPDLPFYPLPRVVFNLNILH